jgi:hypothetical protein
MPQLGGSASAGSELVVRTETSSSGISDPGSPTNPEIHTPPKQGWRRAGRIAGRVAFALTPWLTFGFGTAIAFALAAVLARRRGTVTTIVLWASAAFYAAALTVEVVELDAAEGTSGENVFIACALITVVGGGMQALAIGLTVSLMLILVIYDVSFQRNHQDAQATITSVRVETQCFGWPVPSCTEQYFPTVRFTTGAGEIVEVQTVDFLAEDPETIRTGDTITVHYDPGDPTLVLLGMGWDNQDALLVALLFVLLICEGVLVSRRMRKLRQQGRHAGTTADRRSSEIQS